MPFLTAAPLLSNARAICKVGGVRLYVHYSKNIRSWYVTHTSSPTLDGMVGFPAEGFACNVYHFANKQSLIKTLQAADAAGYTPAS